MGQAVTRVPVRLPGWARWPKTEWLPDERALRVFGRCERPGWYEFHGALYLILLITLLWQLAGPPDIIIGRLVAIATNIGGDKNPGWIALAVVGLSIPVYLFLWCPLMVRLIGDRIDVHFTSDEVRVRMGRNLLGRVQWAAVPTAFAPEFLREQHKRAAAASRHQQNPGSNGFYANSFEVVMRVGETRTVIAEMPEHDEERAAALVIRLQTVMNNFSDIVAAAGGPAAAPQASPDEVYE